MKNQNIKWIVMGLFLFARCADPHSAPITEMRFAKFVPFTQICSAAGTSRSAVFSPNGRWVAIFCSDTIAVFDIENGNEQPTFTLAENKREITPIHAAAFSSDGSQLLIGTDIGPQIRQIPKGQLQLLVRSPLAFTSTSAVAFSHDDQRIALVQNNTIYVAEAKYGRVLASLDYANELNGLESLAFSLDGNNLIAISQSGDYVLDWSMKDLFNTPFVLYSKSITSSGFVAATFRASKDTHYVLAMTSNNLYLWDPINSFPGGDSSAIVYAPLFAVNGATLSSMTASLDGKYVAFGMKPLNKKSIIRLMSTESELSTSSDPQQSMSAEATFDGIFFTPDGNRLFAVTQAGLYQFDLIR